MFRFEHPYLLYLLLVIPLFWLIQLLVWKSNKRKFAAIVDTRLGAELIPLMSFSKRWLKLGVLSAALICLVFALANPQYGSKSEEVKRKGIDLMIALDISNSMQAEDLYPNRISRAKRSIQELLTYLRSDRIGIVVFAGEAFVQLPITTDYAAAKLFLNSIESNLIATQGTDIGNAIELCMNSFDYESPTSKSIILISDGENHEESAVEMVSQAAEQGIVVHTIGMGSIEGAPIPVMSNGKRIGFRKNREGNTVVSKLNEQMLTEVAAAGNGTFVRASNSESGMSYIFEEIENLEKVEIGSKVYTDYEDRFQYFLLPALLLLIIELIIPNTKSMWWRKLFAS